ncbi:MAG: AAA family ATPase, partial [Acetobacteraceae bacterium]|nr:AAA family ATPase [Acetobacteraceae bacterium]
MRASFSGVLETCAVRLDASGRVLASEEELGPAGDDLRISPSFCVIVRTRRDDIFRDDLRRLIDAIQDQSPLPETALRFVVPPPDLPSDDEFDPTPSPSPVPADPWDRTGEEQPGRSRDWLFFPLPSNDEQGEIARRLEQEGVHGVVVQGPPGTGKTHTIANIIGHWMAMGRRVL